MRISTGQLLVERSSGGTWSLRPRDGRNWSSPVSGPESIRTIYGGVSLDHDFGGAAGASHRFRTTVNVFNISGFSGMDGRLMAMVNDVDILERFLFRWPQPLGTDYDAASEPRLSANAAVGDNTLRLRASEAPAAGRLIQLEANGQVHQVTSAPDGRQTAAYSVVVNPAVTKAASAGGAVTVKETEGYARFVARPVPVTSNSQVFRAALVVQEAPR